MSMVWNIELTSGEARDEAQILWQDGAANRRDDLIEGNEAMDFHGTG